MREKIRAVMRYAGSRMFYRHPILTLFHFIDGFRKEPVHIAQTSRPNPQGGFLLLPLLHGPTPNDKSTPSEFQINL